MAYFAPLYSRTVVIPDNKTCAGCVKDKRLREKTDTEEVIYFIFPPTCVE